MVQTLQTIAAHSRDYTLSVAEAMTDEGYRYRPAPESMNFGELMHHIAYGIDWWRENQVEGKETDWSPPAPPPGKDAAVRALQLAYNRLAESMRIGKLSRSGTQGVYSTLDHITHHRGQAVLYLRIKGITPPDYTY